MGARAEIGSLASTVFTSSGFIQLLPLPIHKVVSVLLLGGITASGPVMNGLP